MKKEQNSKVLNNLVMHHFLNSEHREFCLTLAISVGLGQFPNKMECFLLMLKSYLAQWGYCGAKYIIYSLYYI